VCKSPLGTPHVGGKRVNASGKSHQANRPWGGGEQKWEKKSLKKKKLRCGQGHRKRPKKGVSKEGGKKSKHIFSPQKVFVVLSGGGGKWAGKRKQSSSKKKKKKTLGSAPGVFFFLKNKHSKQKHSKKAGIVPNSHMVRKGFFFSRGEKPHKNLQDRLLWVKIVGRNRKLPEKSLKIKKGRGMKGDFSKKFMKRLNKSL